MMEVLAPGFRPPRFSLDDVSVGIAWLDGCDPLVRERIQETARRFPHRRQIDFPVPHGVFPGFMAEVADVHGELFAENRDLYGAGRRRQDRGLPRGHGGAGGQAARDARALP